jgi:hypothetical protein
MMVIFLTNFVGSFLVITNSTKNNNEIRLKLFTGFKTRDYDQQFKKHESKYGLSRDPAQRA